MAADVRLQGLFVVSASLYTQTGLDLIFSFCDVQPAVFAETDGGFLLL